jgi:hypothetical protein
MPVLVAWIWMLICLDALPVKAGCIIPNIKMAMNEYNMVFMILIF